MFETVSNHIQQTRDGENLGFWGKFLGFKFFEGFFKGFIMYKEDGKQILRHIEEHPIHHSQCHIVFVE